MGVLTRRGRRRRTELGIHDDAAWSWARCPDIIFGVVLVYVFAVKLGWVPVAGRAGPDSYVLPVLALAIAPTVILARLMRVEMVSVLQADFIRTARAKRLPARVIYLGHALPNALTASLTVAGLLLSSLVAATVLVENVFAWPGLGGTIVDSILDKDYLIVQAHRARVRHLRAAREPRGRRHPRAARPAFHSSGRTERWAAGAGCAPSGPRSASPLLVLLGAVLTLALVAPIVWGAQAEAIDTSQMLAGPSPEHWAGTDNLGRDILARVLVATRLSVVLALSATAVAVGVGLALGAAPMLVGRRVGSAHHGSA